MFNSGGEDKRVWNVKVMKFYVVKWFRKVLSGALCFWPTITWYEFYRWLAYFCHFEQRAWLQFLIGFKPDIDESGLWKRGIQLTLLQENIRAILLQGSNELRLSFSATKANVILKNFYLRIFILPPRHNFLKRHPSNFILRKISHMTIFFIECWGDRMKQDKIISIVYILLSKSDFYKECWKRELYIFEIMRMKMTVVTIYQK